MSTSGAKSPLLDWMELEYAALAEGLTLSGQDCPACKGRRCMSVSRINRQLLWLCHRASCGFRRGSKYNGTVPERKEETREVIYPETQALPLAVSETLLKNYGIDQRSINRAGVRYLPLDRGDRLYMPIRGPDGELRGWAGRAVEKTTLPKALTKTQFPSSIAWYTNATRTRKVLVVEDQLSAIRASQYMTSVALLGTNLNEQMVKEIMKWNPDEFILCLDRDAFKKAVEYMLEYRHLTNGKMKLVRIDKDVKNMEQEDFEDFMRGL